MLRSTVQKIKIQNFTTHCFGSKSLAARTNHPNPPVLAHTYTKFKINPRLNWLTDLVRIFPGFFSRGGLPKLTRCKIPFGKIRHMICGGNEKRRLLYNCRYQCIILQNISLFLFPFFVLVSCSQRSPVVPLCTDILSSEFCQSNYSTTRPSPRGVAIKQMAHRRNSLSLHILREKIRTKRTFNKPCQVSVDILQSSIATVSSNYISLLCTSHIEYLFFFVLPYSNTIKC